MNLYTNLWKPESKRYQTAEKPVLHIEQAKKQRRKQKKKKKAFNNKKRKSALMLLSKCQFAVMTVTHHHPVGEMELEGNLCSNNKPLTLWSFTRNGYMAACQSLSGTHTSHRDPSSVCTMKKNRFDHAGEDLGHVDVYNLRDHFREVDVRLQSFCLHEQIVGELV